VKCRLPSALFLLRHVGELNFSLRIAFGLLSGAYKGVPAGACRIGCLLLGSNSRTNYTQIWDSVWHIVNELFHLYFKTSARSTYIFSDNLSF